MKKFTLLTLTIDLIMLATGCISWLKSPNFIDIDNVNIV